MHYCTSVTIIPFLRALFVLFRALPAKAITIFGSLQYSSCYGGSTWLVSYKNVDSSVGSFPLHCIPCHDDTSDVSDDDFTWKPVHSETTIFCSALEEKKPYNLAYFKYAKKGMKIPKNKQFPMTLSVEIQMLCILD